MNKKSSFGIGPAGHWLLFAGFPILIITILAASTLRDGNIRGINEKYLPYVVFLVPSAIFVGCRVLYHHVSKRVVIPIGVTCWILAFLVMCWFFWFGPGAIGYHA